MPCPKAVRIAILKTCEEVALHEMDAIGDFVARSVAARHFEGRRGNVRRKYLGVRQFPCQRDGEAAGTSADVSDTQFFARGAGVHVNFSAAESTRRASPRIPDPRIPACR